MNRRITLLERRLGGTLMRRSTRALRLTTDGARLYEHCARVLAAAEGADLAMSGAGDALRGLVRIGAPVAFSQMFLARTFVSLARQYPDIELQLVTNDRFDDALTTDLDVIVRITRLREGDFVAKRLATDRLVIAGAPSYLARRGRPEQPEDLALHDCMHYTLVDFAAEWRHRGKDRAPIAPIAPTAKGRPTFSTNDGTVLKRSMLEGMGLAVLPFFMIAADVAEGRAELVLEGKRAAEIGIYAVVPTVRGLPKRVRAVIDHLRRYFARDDWRG